MPRVHRYLPSILLASFALNGCGGGSDGPRVAAPPPPELGLEFSYPMDGQQDVPVGADVILNLNMPLTPEQMSGRFVLIHPAEGAEVAVTPELLGAGDIVRFDPDAKLQAGTEYRIAYRVSDEATVDWLSFTTQEAGPGTSRPFALAGQHPAEGILPFVDFATLRLRFTAPIDPATARYGSIDEEDATIQMTGPEGIVPAALKVGEDKLVLDPVDDLTPNVEYTVTLTSGLQSLSGAGLDTGDGGAVSFTLTPADSGALASQRLRLVPDGIAAGRTPHSALVGQRLNTMVLESNLIGLNQVGLGGSVEVNVADPSGFDSLIPFTIRKGQLAEAEDLTIRLGGDIPSGLETGTIATEFLTDATGYFFQNPQDSEGPVTAMIFMELGVSPGNTVEQGVVNTEVLHVQGVGTLDIVDGVLMSEVYGTMEIPVLGGVERGTVKFNMRLEGPEEGIVLEPQPPAMEVVSSYPASTLANYPNSATEFFMVDDTILVTFTSGIDPLSVNNGDLINVRLYDGSGTEIPIDIGINGATLQIDPEGGLAYGEEYSLVLDPGIASVTGQVFGTTETIAWTTPAYAPNDDIAPQLMALKPGAPCALVGGNVFSGGEPAIAGRCAGGLPEDQPYALFEAHGADVVTGHFTMPMDESSLSYGDSCGDGTVRVERVDAVGSCLEVVPGYMRVTQREFTFVPEDPWTPGQLYRVVLESEEIEGINGLALNSNPLAGPDGDDGAEPPVEIPFIGRPDDGFSLQPLLARPFTDINGDFEVDEVEEFHGSASATMEVMDIDGNVTYAEFLRHDGEYDPSTTTYFNYAMLVEIGEIEQAGRIPVRVTPQYQIGTEVTLRAFYLSSIRSDVTTGPVILRPKQTYTGYIEPALGGGRARFVLDIELYLDAPYAEMETTLFGQTTILGSELDTGIDPRSLIQSQEIQVRLSGPIYNLPDGRIALDLSNENLITAVTEIRPNPHTPERLQWLLDFLGWERLPVGRGDITLGMRPENVRLRLVGPPLKGLGRVLGAR